MGAAAAGEEDGVVAAEHACCAFMRVWSAQAEGGGAATGEEVLWRPSDGTVPNFPGLTVLIPDELSKISRFPVGPTPSFPVGAV